MGRAILLAAPMGEAARIILDTEAGIVIPPESPDALAKTVGALYRSPDKLARFAGNGLASAPRFSREKQARETLNALEQAVARPSISPWIRHYGRA